MNQWQIKPTNMLRSMMMMLVVLSWEVDVNSSMAVLVALSQPKSIVSCLKALNGERIADIPQGSLYMSRLTGGKVTEGEARRVLQPYGPVESCWWSSKTEREMYQLPEGIWVKFAYFQDCRDAQSVGEMTLLLYNQPKLTKASIQAFRDDSQYRLEQPPTPPEPTGRSPPRRTFQSSRPTWNNRVQARLEQGPIFETLLRQEIDRRSIFIGNLSEGTSKERVTQVFEVYGTVVHVDLVVKPSAHRESSCPTSCALC